MEGRFVEQPINLDDGDDVSNWPWLYGVEVGHWDLTDAQAAKLRDFLLRGGFFMCDDFHGTEEWQVFFSGMGRGFPRRAPFCVDKKGCVFHPPFHLGGRYPRPRAPVLDTR